MGMSGHGNQTPEFLKMPGDSILQRRFGTTDSSKEAAVVCLKEHRRGNEAVLLATPVIS